jgi:general secretion pathway protein H
VKRPRHRASGFTLVEMLIVVVIIGIVATIVTLSTGVLGRDSEMEDQAKRVSAVVGQAREEAELQGLEMGILVAKNSYEFVQYDRRKQIWMPVEGDPLYESRELPPGLSFRLWLEQKEVVLKPDLEAYAKPPEKLTPHIMILSSGEVMPFDLRLEREGTDTRWHVSAGADNSLGAEEIKGV